MSQTESMLASVGVRGPVNKAPVVESILKNDEIELKQIDGSWKHDANSIWIVYNRPLEVERTWQWRSCVSCFLQFDAKNGSGLIGSKSIVRNCICPSVIVVPSLPNGSDWRMTWGGIGKVLNQSWFFWASSPSGESTWVQSKRLVLRRVSITFHKAIKRNKTFIFGGTIEFGTKGEFYRTDGMGGGRNDCGIYPTHSLQDTNSDWSSNWTWDLRFTATWCILHIVDATVF